jgi:hypothetical protein
MLQDEVPELVSRGEALQVKIATARNDDPCASGLSDTRAQKRIEWAKEKKDTELFDQSEDVDSYTPSFGA